MCIRDSYDTKYEPQMSPLLLFAINFILPFVFIMLMFSLVMRIMAKKGGMGGMGGIGLSLIHICIRVPISATALPHSTGNTLSSRTP